MHAAARAGKCSRTEAEQALQDAGFPSAQACACVDDRSAPAPVPEG